MLISGHFRATYGSSIGLFAGLRTPIVERFEPANEIRDLNGFRRSLRRSAGSFMLRLNLSNSAATATRSAATE
jgi:hypothetical protein